MAYKKEDKEKILSDIFFNIAEGNTLRKQLKKHKISSSTFFKWIDSDEEKAKQYARALQLRAEAKFESIEEDYSEKPKIDPETGRIDTGWVQLQRLKIDAKKWELGKLNPKKYGDKIDITSGNKPINNTIPLVLQDGRTYDDLKNELQPE